jgi:hypothetical protein
MRRAGELTAIQLPDAGLRDLTCLAPRKMPELGERSPLDKLQEGKGVRGK